MTIYKLFKEFCTPESPCYNGIMYKLYPYFTNDGSVGLFSPDADDIYHSTYGALTEAVEKFILPMDLKKYFEHNNEIKILDICFGIGYNSKTFLDFFLKNILYENNSTVAIGSDNILNNTKGSFSNIYIKAIDTDKYLSYLSPFFVTGKRFCKNNKLTFKQDKIEKLLNTKTENNKQYKNENCKTFQNDKNNNNASMTFINYIKNFLIEKPKLSEVTNIIFLKEIIKNSPDFLTDFEINRILSDKIYSKYFDRNIVHLFNFERNQRYKYTPIRRLNCFLHNIYYNHLSTSYKKALKCLNLCNFNFDLKIDDARKVIQEDNNLYNFVFLDAFTPAKCPCLWTLDFFKLLYKHLDDNGMIFTYSNSASVRNAFVQAGFGVGKIYNSSAGKFMGTVAAKNKLLIKNELSEYDLGLLKTKAGIVYRDENLSATNEAIINAHKIDVDNSKLESSSGYIKKSRRTNNV